MRVLTFLHSFEPGGVERVALRLNLAWAEAGHDITVVVGRDEGAMRSEAGALPLTFLSTGRVSTRHWETLFMILTLPRAVRREQPDVLFCAGNTYTIVAVALKLLLGRACPPIAAKVSNDLVRPDFSPLVRWFYSRWLRMQARVIDLYVGIAEPMRDEIVTLTGIERRRVAVVNDPATSVASIAAFADEPRAPSKGRRYVGIGRLSPQKNFGLAIDAFARIARPEDRLTILGEGAERTALERQAARLGVADRIHLPGFVTDLPARLADADVFVLSSDYEGLPAVVIDALAAGIAIVATDCSVSMADLLDHGRLGMLVRVGDRAALAAAMVKAAAASPHRAALRERALQFTLEAAAPAWWMLFESLAPSTPASAAASHTDRFLAKG